MGGVFTLIDDFSDIKDSVNWSNIFEIRTNSVDTSKYLVIRKDKTKNLLIVSNIFLYEEFKNQAVLGDLIYSETGLNMNVPIEVAAFRGDLGAYALYTWVDGDNAETVLKELPMPMQMKFGVKVGKMLWKFHTVPSPEKFGSRYDFYDEEIRRNKALYTSMSLNIRGEKALIAFLDASLALILDRPKVAIHGKFNVMNIIGAGEEVGIISPQHVLFGDPLEDFRGMLYTENVAFKRGMIKGYFDNTDVGNRPTNGELRLIAFYTAFELLSMLTKNVSRTVDELRETKRIAEKVMQSYDDFNSCIPNWY